MINLTRVNEQIKSRDSLPKVTVLILAYNNQKDVVSCLKSIQQIAYSNYDIVLVDNASKDDTVDAVAKDFPFVKIIRNSKNVGRTAGYNVGIKHCRGDMIFFLDQDTIVDKYLLTELVSASISDPLIGAVGPVIFYFDHPNRVWSAGTCVNLLTGKTKFLNQDQRKTNDLTSIREVQQHPTAILVKKEVIDIIGGYDDSLFMVYCDSDFCMKIWKSGYKIVLAPKAKLWHKETLPVDHCSLLGMTSPKRAFLIARNRIIFMKTYAGTLNFISFMGLFLPVYVLYYTANMIAEKRHNLLKFYWKGTLMGLSYVLGFTSQNKRILNWLQSG